MLAASNYSAVLEPLHRATIPQDEDGKVKITKVDELADKSLLVYLETRRINLAFARAYCKQADFTIGHRKYTAIAFANRSGGYELRNSFMKVCSSPKDITLIDNGSKDLKTVEGFIDFLSLLTMQPKDHRSFNYLILNSVNLLSRALEIMGEYQNIFTYYDQDTSGRKATELVSNTFKNAVDASGFYSSSEDLNDYWIAQRRRGRSLI
ncbi:toprim domain-containing protein [Pedobacter steynii]